MHTDHVVVYADDSCRTSEYIVCWRLMVHSVNVAKDDVTMVRDAARYRQKTGGRTRKQLLVRLTDELHAVI